MKRQGFTLIELLIVFILIGILSLLAYPSYSKHLVRTRRIHIEALLLDRAIGVEKHYLAKNTYIGADEVLDTEYYRIRLISEKNSYVLKAIPIGVQEQDKACGILTLDQDGSRGSSGFKSVAECCQR